MANEQLIQRINKVFLDLMIEENSQQYEQYFKAINRAMIDSVETLDRKKVKDIISKQSINIDNAILLYALQNAITLVLENRIKAMKNDKLLPIIALMGIYNISKPKRFFNKMLKISKGRGLNPTEIKTRALIKTFEKSNAQILSRARKIAIERTELNIVKSNRNKRMLRDFKRLRQEGKTIKQIETALTRKYNSKTNIKRVINTEIHNQVELVKQEMSIAQGYTHKTWKQKFRLTRRQTCFHEAVANKRIPINSDFRACGMRAQRPGDDRLPPGEVINCDCYLVFD